jgi:hypothetical protein
MLGWQSFTQGGVEGNPVTRGHHKGSSLLLAFNQFLLNLFHVFDAKVAAGQSSQVMASGR